MCYPVDGDTLTIHNTPMGNVQAEIIREPLLRQPFLGGFGSQSFRPGLDPHNLKPASEYPMVVVEWTKSGIKKVTWDGKALPQKDN